jgi:8-oxo-dGTP pyrophosphatase MutT (NUDIX family)
MGADRQTVGLKEGAVSEDGYRVLNSRHVLETPWIAVREDAFVTPEGVVHQPYYVVEYPDWVHVVAIDDDRRLLLVRQYRHGMGAETLELPAGKIDATDAGPKDAAARELLEETGCAARTFRLIGTHWANPANQNNRIFTVLAEGVHRVQAPQDDPHERVETVWRSLDEAMEVAREMQALFQSGSLLLALAEIPARGV